MMLSSPITLLQAQIGDGIYAFNITNGQIIDNTIDSVNYDGVDLEDSSNTKINDNQIGLNGAIR